MTTPYIDLSTVHVPVGGASPTVAWGLDIQTNFATIANPPGCIVQRTAALAVVNGTGTVLPFTAADIRDTDAYHDTVTNPSRMTVPTGLGGLYLIQCQVVYAANATGQRTMYLQKNGGTVLTVGNDFQNNGAGITSCLEHSMMVILAAGDYVEVGLFQLSGGNLNVTAAQASIVWQGAS